VKDVVTVRPGYSYPDTGEPVPAIVVAVTRGTAPVQAAELEKRFGVPFNVTDATVEEQLAKQTKPSDAVSLNKQAASIQRSPCPSGGWGSPSPTGAG
jgi:hypothetical protein